MTKTRTLAIAAMLLMALDGAALAEAAPTAAPAATDAECNRVFKAKAEADKTISSQQLARDLNLSLETVNACLLRMRRVPRTPHAGE
jgi:DNA-binding CsgD family transcriptional regulator